MIDFQKKESSVAPRREEHPQEWISVLGHMAESIVRLVRTAQFNLKRTSREDTTKKQPRLAGSQYRS